MLRPVPGGGGVVNIADVLEIILAVVIVVIFAVLILAALEEEQ